MTSSEVPQELLGQLMAFDAALQQVMERVEDHDFLVSFLDPILERLDVLMRRDPITNVIQLFMLLGGMRDMLTSGEPIDSSGFRGIEFEAHVHLVRDIIEELTVPSPNHPLDVANTGPSFLSLLLTGNFFWPILPIIGKADRRNEHAHGNRS